MFLEAYGLGRRCVAQFAIGAICRLPRGVAIVFRRGVAGETVAALVVSRKTAVARAREDDFFAAHMRLTLCRCVYLTIGIVWCRPRILGFLW